MFRRARTSPSDQFLYLFIVHKISPAVSGEPCFLPRGQHEQVVIWIKLVVNAFFASPPTFVLAEDFCIGPQVVGFVLGVGELTKISGMHVEETVGLLSGCCQPRCVVW